MLKILISYMSIALVFSLVNLTRYLRCSYLKIAYNMNFDNKESTKNINFSVSAFSLFKKAKLNMIGLNATDIMTNSIYKDEIINAFDYSKGYFRYKSLHSVFWIFHILENSFLFAPTQKISNRFISVIIAVLESFAVYLLGLYLDTTGIGNKILTFLLDALTAISELPK